MDCPVAPQLSRRKSVRALNVADVQLRCAQRSLGLTRDRRDAREANAELPERQFSVMADAGLGPL